MLRLVYLLALCVTTVSQPLLSAGASCFLGSGFDITVGCVKASALDKPIAPCATPSDPGPCSQTEAQSEERAYTRNVQNSQEYSSMMSTAVSAEGGGFGFHVSASVSYMHESQTTERSISLFLGQSGTVKTDSIRGVTGMIASEAALELLDQCNSAANCSFVERYGLHYIHQITYGRSFLGSFTLWDKTTSKSQSLDTMASFSASDVFFSAKGSAEFKTAQSRFEENLETIASAQWIGGTGVSLDSSTPEQMHATFQKWNQTSFDNPSKMTMSYRNWIDLPEVQAIVNKKSSEVQILFTPQQIASATTDQLTVELGKANYAYSAVNHALAWDCGQEDSGFNSALVSLHQDITTHLARIQTIDEAGVIEVQAEILSGDYTFFIADDQLKQYNSMVDKYFPDGSCGVCVEVYKCGSSCCDTTDYPVCCPAYPGQQDYDYCVPAGSTCCTDDFHCINGANCYSAEKTCCGDGDFGCPSADGSSEGSCCSPDYGVCCGVQGADGCCNKDYSVCCGAQGYDGCCPSEYPTCDSTGFCHKSVEARDLGFLDFIPMQPNMGKPSKVARLFHVSKSAMSRKS